MDKKLLVTLVVIIGVVGVLVVSFLTYNPMLTYIDELKDVGFTVNIWSDKWELRRENYLEIDVHYQHEDQNNFIEWAVFANVFYEIIESDFVIWGDEEANVFFMYIPSFQLLDRHRWNRCILQPLIQNN